MRLFVAAVPDDETREWIASQQSRFQQELKPFQRELRWVRAESVHITLTFLGEIPESQLVEEALLKCRPVQTELELGGLGLFPGPRRPSVFWMGCADVAQEISRLQAEIAEAMHPFVEPERRAFVPHLTLARIKPEPRSSLGETVNAMQHEERKVWKVSSFALMRSVLGAGGARYEVVREFL